MRRVLVVDPDASFRALIALVLEIEGFTVLTAGSMAEALQIARRAHPDVISINVGAPGLDGWSLSRQLRADSATASKRQMIVDGGGAVADGVPARVDAVLTGRADTAGFAEALRRVLRRPPEGAQPHPLAADLDAVLERRLIRPLFQPIVDLDSGDVVGVEALARGPAGPLHTPIALFEVANQVDRLHELDSLCRLTAITTARDAAAHAPPLVFVNVEPGTVDLPMSAELRAVLSRGLPFQIVVEFTERALYATAARAAAARRRDPSPRQRGRAGRHRGRPAIGGGAAPGPAGDREARHVVARPRAPGARDSGGSRGGGLRRPDRCRGRRRGHRDRRAAPGRAHARRQVGSGLALRAPRPDG